MNGRCDRERRRADKAVRPRNTRSFVAHLREVGAPVEELRLTGDYGSTVDVALVCARAVKR